VSRPALLRPYAESLAALLPSPEVVCGPPTGGAFVAQLVAESLDVAFAWSTPSVVTGPVAGRRVAIVDDAINAGSAVRAAASALRSAGGTVVAVAALLALGAAPPSLAGVPVQHLVTVPSGLWPAGRCPLCVAGAPLDEPPS